MIKEFKNNPIRDTGIINRGMFEQVKMLYMQNPTAGGELAVSLMEHVLTGDHSSDDFMVAFSIANHKETISKAQHNYDLSKETKQNVIEEELRKYVELHKQGLTQAEIAKKLGGTQSNVSKKLTKARKEFPHLFQDEEYSKNIPNIPEYSDDEIHIPNEEYIPDIPNIPVFQIFQDVNENINNNVNVNENDEGMISPAGESGLRPDTSSSGSKGKIKFNF